MRAAYEYIATEAAGEGSFHAFVRESDGFEFNWHYHKEVELTLILDSAGQRLVGNSVQDYGPGDLVLLGSNLPHTWRSNPQPRPSGHQAVVVQFREELLGIPFVRLPEFSGIVRLLQRAAIGLSFNEVMDAADLRQAVERLPALPPARRLLTLLDVLMRLAEVSDARPLSSPSFQPRLRGVDEQRIDRVCNYVTKHFAEPISQKAVATMVNMNPAAFCRFFKQITGRTFSDYVNGFRISMACQQLTETNASVTRIAYEVGYGSHAHFNRQFRKHTGFSPRDYRGQFSDPPPPSRSSAPPGLPAAPSGAPSRCS